MTWRIVNVLSYRCCLLREEKTTRLATVLLAGDDEKSTPRSLKYGVSFVHDEAPCCRIQGTTAHFVKYGSLSSLKARKRRDISCDSFIGKLGHAMRRKRLSAVELVNIYLDRVS